MGLIVDGMTTNRPAMSVLFKPSAMSARAITLNTLEVKPEKGSFGQPSRIAVRQYCLHPGTISGLVEFKSTSKMPAVKESIDGFSGHLRTFPGDTRICRTRVAGTLLSANESPHLNAWSE